MKKWSIHLLVLLSCFALVAPAKGDFSLAAPTHVFSQTSASYNDLSSSAGAHEDSQQDSPEDAWGSANAGADASVSGANATADGTYSARAQAMAGVTLTSGLLGLGTDVVLNTEYSGTITPFEHLEAYATTFASLSFTVGPDSVTGVQVMLEGSNTGEYWGEIQNSSPTTTYTLRNITTGSTVLEISEFDIADVHMTELTLLGGNEYAFSIESVATLYESSLFPDSGLHIMNSLCLNLVPGSPLPQIMLPDPDLPADTVPIGPRVLPIVPVPLPGAFLLASLGLGVANWKLRRRTPRSTG
jgi:hypothetical protein